ncbi:hypothetical protein F443_18525 [Phytophthora nicotianae P1569]|uniref:Uncharacterized protein n=1 Tax=Phytophthora nicotianae P1569 TaxID=1317065 RepID=V9E9Y2_PHYNI|nr:hypothetical protein F443_18525 [Phytophthora nicotianae P1569]
MQVRGALDVVTREDRDHLGDTVLVRWGDTAQERVVEVGGVAAVAIAVSDHTRVHTCRISVPEVDVHVRDGLTRADVNDLYVNVHVDAGLIFAHIGSDVLTQDVVRTVRDFRLKDACHLVTKQHAGRRVGSDSCEVRLVVCGHHRVDVKTALATFTTKVVDSLGTTGHSTLLELAHGLGIGAVSECMLGVGNE